MFKIEPGVKHEVFLNIVVVNSSQIIKKKMLFVKNFCKGKCRMGFRFRILCLNKKLLRNNYRKHNLT